jgi:ATP-binding cassette, subfamily B, bacterial PglK
MIRTCQQLYDLLDHRERRRAGILFVMVILSAVLDVVGIASILPFLGAVSDPESVQTSALLAPLYRTLAFENDTHFLIALGVMVFVLVVLGAVAKILVIYAMARFSHMRHHSISRRLLQRYLSHPYVWFLNQHSAELGKNVLYEVERMIGESMIPALRIGAQAASLVCLVLLLVIVQPWVAFISAAVLGGIYLTVYFIVRQKMTKLGIRRTNDNTERYRVATEAFGGIKDVKLMGLERRYLDRYSAPSYSLAEGSSLNQVIGEMPRHLLEVVAFGGMVGLILYMLLTGSGDIAEIIPTLGVFAFAALRMFPAMQQIYHSLTLIRFSSAILNNVHGAMSDLKAAPQVNLPSGTASPMTLSDALELRDVRYVYPNTERPSLNGVTARIAAKTTVGIVGGSGAGKTTLMDIILGLLTPQSGQMLVNGAAVTQANIRSWQRTTGYVPQQIFLVDSTVAENIAFGLPADEVDLQAVIRAARIANLHDFVLSDLPDGYHTQVGERGVRLSGGQRQRIGIARALYHNPDVLILDEATSALDNLTEKAVMDAVQNLAHVKTIVIVAHRLSTVRHCDNILLMEGGVVAAQGTYDDLVLQNDTFRRMAGATL